MRVFGSAEMCITNVLCIRGGGRTVGSWNPSDCVSSPAQFSCACEAAVVVVVDVPALCAAAHVEDTTWHGPRRGGGAIRRQPFNSAAAECGRGQNKGTKRVCCQRLSQESLNERD